MLVQNFIHNNLMKTDKNITGLTPEALQILNDYPWPGNVRELRNCIEYAFVLCRDEMIAPEHLPPKITGRVTSNAQAFSNFSENPLERDQLLKALSDAGGNQTEAARLLGVSRVTVWKRMKKYGINANPHLR
jgi:transcriptional regulator of acetoin/glycerol metabolism